ncbi:MAG: phosphate ABC transporter substrate-binding protein [Cyanobacteria bacterium P01_G01_bin.54]
MTQKKDNPSLIVTLLVTGGILAGGVWLLAGPERTAEINGVEVAIGSGEPEETPETTAQNPAATPAPVAANTPPTAAPNPASASPNPFPVPTTVASGTQVFIDGSTSMVQINVALKDRFETRFVGTRVELKAQGSSKGIEALRAGTVDLAASSRPLKPEEAAAGLKTVVVAPDQIALVVSKDNPFRGSLTPEQVAGIFTGQITNWSAVEGADLPIRVINRPPVSGTYTAFTELALNGQAVSGPGVTTLERDETTGMLQQLGSDGIGYATHNQVANQSTVRTLSVNNTFPEQPNYPYQRQLLYVYQEPASEAVKAFLGFLGTPEAQSAIAAGMI